MIGRWLRVLVVPAVIVAVGVGFSVPVAAAASGGGNGGVTPLAVVGPVVKNGGAGCVALGFGCYFPSDMGAEYDFTSLWNGGVTGAGQTIVIFDSFGSPTIKQDLATFDTEFQLPAPPSFHIYEPEGAVALNYQGLPSPADYHNKYITNEIGWAFETTLDVEWAHAMAPDANIALVVTPNAETEGVQGLQNLLNAQQWALSHHIGNIWSDSWATTEQAFQDPSILQQLDHFYATAAAAGVNAFFSSGDSGAANVDKQGQLYPFATVTYPASSPNVISVGGTQITTPVTTINSHLPETAWNDEYGATGGGYSAVFARPPYQDGIVNNSQRGVPDVSYNAGLVSPVLIFASFDGPGFYAIGGTSAGSPQWAAVAALAQQVKDEPLGFLNPQLYQLAGTSAFHDITSGDNSFAGIDGYNATGGWDPATGLGTPDAANLVYDLAAN